MSPLQWKCRTVLAKGDADKAKALLEIMKKERKIKRWRKMRNVAGKRRGRSVVSVKVPIVDTEGNNASSECTTN